MGGLAAVACGPKAETDVDGRGPAADTTAPVSQEGDSAGVRVPADSAVPDTTMPDVPAAVNGALVLQSASSKPEYRLRGTWPLAAVRCDVPDLIQVFLYQPTFGFGLVLAPPADTSAVTTYRLVRGQSGIPEGGTARAAFQWYPGDKALAMSAVYGDVELLRSDDSLSGWFQVTLFETVFRDTVRLAGSFTDLPVDHRDDGPACLVLGRDDSTRATTPPAGTRG